MPNACQDVLPAQFLERLAELCTREEYTSVLEAFAALKPTTLRTNTIKTTDEIVLKELTAAGVKLQPVSAIPHAFLVTDTPFRLITEHPLYTSGSIYVQSLSSMLPPLVLDPQLNDLVLDLTAAPGSKTTQLAAMMQNTGRIIANDMSPIRLFKLQANVKLQGAANVYVRRGRGEELWQKFPEYFDRTLVDVPCTMEGRISCDDPDTYQDWSLQKIKMLSRRQSHLLRSAITATKPGGVIVYSTCTLAPEENELVINWLLEKEGDGVELESFTLPSSINTKPGLVEWGKHAFDPRLTKTVRVLPSPTTEGFFIAKLRKLRSTLPEIQPPIRHFRPKSHTRHRR